MAVEIFLVALIVNILLMRKPPISARTAETALHNHSSLVKNTPIKPNTLHSGFPKRQARRLAIPLAAYLFMTSSVYTAIPGSPTRTAKLPTYVTPTEN